MIIKDIHWKWLKLNKISRNWRVFDKISRFLQKILNFWIKYQIFQKHSHFQWNFSPRKKKHTTNQIYLPMQQYIINTHYTYKTKTYKRRARAIKKKISIYRFFSAQKQQHNFRASERVAVWAVLRERKRESEREKFVSWMENEFFFGKFLLSAPCCSRVVLLFFELMKKFFFFERNFDGNLRIFN